MDIFAHRGYSALYPENTMIAFEKALQYGCSGIELDVQMTKDEKLVVIHDEKINRLTSSRGFVKDYSYDDLKNLDFGKWRRGSGFQTLPLLSEVLDLINKNNEKMTPEDSVIKLNIELKNSEIFYPGIELAVVEEVERWNLPNEIIYSSFNHESIKILNKMNKGLITAPLLDKNINNMVNYVKDLGCGGVHTTKVNLTERLTKEIVNAGLFLNVYTVNDLRMAKKLKGYGVSGIFTDFSREFMEVFKWKKA